MSENATTDANPGTREFTQEQAQAMYTVLCEVRDCLEGVSYDSDADVGDAPAARIGQARGTLSWLVHDGMSEFELLRVSNKERSNV